MTLWSLNLEFDLKLDMSLQTPGDKNSKFHILTLPTPKGR